MLLSYIDSEVQKKLIGLENKYEKAMDKLDQYYRDTRNAVQACTAEIRSILRFNQLTKRRCCP